MDEDVFLEDTLIDEDTQILRDFEERQALASRLAKWARPALSSAYLNQTQSIGNLLFSSILILGFNEGFWVFCVNLGFTCCSVSAIGDRLRDWREPQGAFD